MLTYEIEFVDIRNSRKFSYMGIRKVEFGVNGRVFITGVDPITNERYYVVVSELDFDYFTVNKEDKEDE